MALLFLLGPRFAPSREGYRPHFLCSLSALGWYDIYSSFFFQHRGPRSTAGYYCYTYYMVGGVFVFSAFVGGLTKCRSEHREEEETTKKDCNMLVLWFVESWNRLLGGEAVGYIHTYMHTVHAWIDWRRQR